MLRGEAPIRCDDLLSDPRYGTTAPADGLPGRTSAGAQLPGGAGAVADRRGHRRVVLRPPGNRRVHGTGGTADRRRGGAGRHRHRQCAALRSGPTGGGRAQDAPRKRARGAHRGRADERRQGRVSRDAVPRAPDAAERHPRLVAGPADRFEERDRLRQGPRDHRAQRAHADPADRRSARHEPDHVREDPPGHSDGPPAGVHRSGGGNGEARGRRQGHQAREDARSGGGADLGRSGPAPAGRLEPRVQRHQVHAEGRQGSDPARTRELP